MRTIALLCVVLGITVFVHDARASAVSSRLPVVLRRGGARVGGGHLDDAGRLVSRIVAEAGRRVVTVPAFEGSNAEWQQLLSCVRARYRGLPVDFVETPPADDRFVLLVVGGEPQVFGKTGLWGLSSTGMAAVVPRGVGFVFSAAVPGKRREIPLCETVAHEVGHMIGLQHSTDCDDLMSSNLACAKQARGRLRGFSRPNWTVLARSLASWIQQGANH